MLGLHYGMRFEFGHQSFHPSSPYTWQNPSRPAYLPILNQLSGGISIHFEIVTTDKEHMQKVRVANNAWGKLWKNILIRLLHLD
jgi:hypothetical protein